MSTKLILIRHGQTAWNRHKKYCGAKDIGLDATGKAQAKKLCRVLKLQQVHKIYASSKKRALQTARLAFGAADIERVADLREIHFGVFEGLNHAQIMQKYPLAYKKWLHNPFSITIPEGESLTDFKSRIVGAIKKIASLNKNKTVAVVCHGGAISIFLNHILKSRKFWQHIPSSASISVIEYRSGKPRVKLFNDTAHLKEI